MITHKMTKTPEYSSWHSMKSRCLNTNVKNYHRYGGRGITVCDRWRESFINFYTDMGPRPSLLHTLDRIDNNSNYEPGNCRWATKVEQANNRSTNIYIPVNNNDVSPKEAMQYYNLKKGTLHSRLARGTPLDTPVMEHNFKYQYKNQLLTSAELSTISKVPVNLIRSRIASGMDIEKAVCMPVNETDKHEFRGGYYTVQEICAMTNVLDYNLRHHLRKGVPADKVVEILSKEDIRYPYLDSYYTLKEIVVLTNINHGTLYPRVVTQKQSVEQAVAEIIANLNKDKYLYKGEMLTIPELCKVTGYKYKALNRHLKRGLSVEEALKIIDYNISIRPK